MKKRKLIRSVHSSKGFVNVDFLEEEPTGNFVIRFWQSKKDSTTDKNFEFEVSLNEKQFDSFKACMDAHYSEKLEELERSFFTNMMALRLLEEIEKKRRGVK